jgi:predicted metalloendopeptidase
MAPSPARYDDKGRKFDGDGNLNDWWTEADAALFKTKTEIMSKQAEKCGLDNSNFGANKLLVGAMVS